jgi:hypothetical protein
MRGNTFGIFGFAYITNHETYISELEKQIGSTVYEREFNINFFNAKKNNLLKFYSQYGYLTDEPSSFYAVYETRLKNNEGKEIIGFFNRNRLDKKWSGIDFSTFEDFLNVVQDNLKFRMGRIYFDTWQEGLDFLEELKETAIPEKWTYNKHSSSIPHPILKSYIENTLEKMCKSTDEGYIIFSDDRKYLIFNTGLLDKFFHDIYLICYVDNLNNNLKFKNPFIMKSFSDLNKIKFYKDKVIPNKSIQLPPKVKFFTNVNEVVFQADITIDRNYEKFTHIIEERRERFPKEYQNKDTTHLARLLDNSINYAISVAERNYKLIVPQYRPQDNKLQLLMPIYLNGTYTKTPDFALVLNLEDNLYIPETILPLDAAYQNARLIAKPDDFWLNPEDI